MSGSLDTKRPTWVVSGTDGETHLVNRGAPFVFVHRPLLTCGQVSEFTGEATRGEPSCRKCAPGARRAA